MKIKIAIMFMLLTSVKYSLATTRIAVIDTGFDFHSKWSVQPKLCKFGHRDFTKTGIQDNHGHGTHVSGLIAKYAKNADYCLIILKFYDLRSTPETVKNGIKAINYAIKLKVDIINFSAGGEEFNDQEQSAVLNALENSIMFVAAAGNESSNLTKKTFYPALYDSRIVVVGALNEHGKNLRSSNYGPQVDFREVGKQMSILPKGKYGLMEGTSQATAIITGKIVKEISKLKKLDRGLATK